MRKLLSTLLIYVFVVPLLHAQNVDVLHYRFAINLNDQNDSIYGIAQIKLVTKASGPLLLDLYQNDANGKGMLVTQVEKESSTGNYPFSQKQNQLILPLIKGKASDTLSFRIFYKGIPADGLVISKNKFGERTFFADNWPNRAHNWLPCNDRPDDKASFEFFVTAPAHYTVVANGVKKAEKATANNTTLTHWAEDTPLPTKVMAIGVAHFAVKTFTDSPAGIPVSAWVYPKDSTKGFYDYALAPAILKFFSNYIAPFPYKKLANVQSTTIFGGMENASCIFYAESSVTGNRSSEDLIAHEVAHQWFGNMASEKSFAHLWLSEGFASYLTHCYREAKYGREAMIRQLKKDRNEVIRFAKMTSSPVVDSTENLMSLLNANSYQKGSWILHMLRTEVGDTAFQKIIRTYYNQYKGSNAETSDFQAVAEGVSGKDLKWFFDQWLYRPGIPKLSVLKVKEGNQVKLKIVQSGDVYRMPLTLRIAGDGGRIVRERLLLTGRETESAWRGKASSVVQVSLDPDCTLLFEEIPATRHSK